MPPLKYADFARFLALARTKPVVTGELFSESDCKMRSKILSFQRFFEDYY